MTDRPRTWAFYGASHQAVAPGEFVRVVEWNRERVVPVVMAAILEYLQAGEGDTYDPRGEADAIFDALDREQGR